MKKFNLPRVVDLAPLSPSFTLFELIIVITMVVILSAAILPSFSNYINDQNVRQAGEQVRSDIRSAQNKALTGGASDELINGVTKPLYWVIRFVDDTSTYHFYTAATQDMCSSPTSSNSIDQGPSTSLPGNSVIALSSSPTCVFINFANGGAISQQNIYLKSSSSQLCVRVTIETSGLVTLTQGGTCP